MTICPRGCFERITTKKGRKKKIVDVPVEMKEGAILLTCPICNFQCRAYDVKINEPQPMLTTPFN